MSDMTIKDLADRLKVERRDVTVQTAISASDSEVLDQLVEWFQAQGVNTNRSGVLRAVLLDSLEAFKETQAEDAASVTTPESPSGDPGDASGYFPPRMIRDEPQA